MVDAALGSMSQVRFQQLRRILWIATWVALVAKLLNFLPSNVTLLHIVSPFILFWGVIYTTGFIMALLEVYNERNSRVSKNRPDKPWG